MRRPRGPGRLSVVVEDDSQHQHWSVVTHESAVGPYLLDEVVCPRDASEEGVRVSVGEDRQVVREHQVLSTRA